VSVLSIHFAKKIATAPYGWTVRPVFLLLGRFLSAFLLATASHKASLVEGFTKGSPGVAPSLSELYQSSFLSRQEALVGSYGDNYEQPWSAVTIVWSW
jgi:hypothetical protein